LTLRKTSNIAKLVMNSQETARQSILKTQMTMYVLHPLF